MVQNLAGSLALVTCKEPLRVACGNHLRSLLQQAGADAQLMEQVVQVCAADNLDLGCTLIEKAATEKAVRDVEEALAPAFAIRRKHREQTGLPYYDMSIFTNGRYPASLPEALRPKPGGLLPAQRRVYEDFGRIPRTAAAMGIVPGQTPGATGVAGAAGVAGQPATGAANPLFAQQAGAGGAYGAAGTQAAQALLGQTGASPARVGGIPGCGSADGLAGMAAAMGGAQLPSGFGGGSTGQLPGVGAAAGAVSGDGAQLSTAQVIDKASITVAKLDMLVQQLAAQGVTSIATLAADDNLHGLLAQISAVVASSVSRDETALALVNKIFKRAFEQHSSANGAAARLHTQVNVQLICRIHAVCPKVARFVTEMTLYSDAERKLNREIMFPLIQAGMVQPAEFTAHLAKHLDGGRNGAAVAFSMALVRTLVLDERAVAADACGDLLSALSQLAKHPSPPEGLLRLLDDARMSLNAPGAAAAVGGGRKAAAAAVEDPAVARVKAEVAPLWEEWLGICDQAHQSDKAYATFLQQLAGTGWLAPTEAGTNFLRAVVDLAISAATAGGDSSGGKLPLAIAQLDALSKLVLVMVKAAEGPAPTPAQAAQAADAKPKAQMALLTRVLAAVIAHLVKSYDTRPFDFNQRAYFRLFSSWLFELNAPDPALDPIQPQVLAAFGRVFSALQPSRLPGFAFAWMELRRLKDDPG